ncbi:MAG: DUF4259 domain-containing protein [Brevundimonas sp.]|uniref:DUF4259 domain-containing protein n=1 Tax=Brevundimonas sp. TaxID=1871086 RepID=UPI0026100AF0|nr:DUF4259 domain-containing protein [Brevundimonas sp.]MDI6624410.1 DUF4259 domain-containing protein [Brevundimonas sp.]MDQ7813233.1 DUF4259 domain-containing protein [Brevundimonas sp.]
MGAWGLGVFDNDEAGDFLWEVEEGEASRKIVGAMVRVVTTFGYLEAPEAVRGLAAAALVASRRDPGVFRAGNEETGVSATLPALPFYAAYLARLTISRVISRSELADLWDEAGELEDWRDDARRYLKVL